MIVYKGATNFLKGFCVMNKRTGILIVLGIVASIVLVGFLMWFLPTYEVWRCGMTGKARLQQAEQEKQIMIETARAEAEAAILKAEAITTVGAAAKEFPEYRQQEFIAAFGEAIQSGQVEQIIYVPTEANIPIVEAGRMVK